MERLINIYPKLNELVLPLPNQFSKNLFLLELINKDSDDTILFSIEKTAMSRKLIDQKMKTQDKIWDLTYKEYLIIPIFAQYLVL
jgi:hypothetical protein